MRLRDVPCNVSVASREPAEEATIFSIWKSDSKFNNFQKKNCFWNLKKIGRAFTITSLFRLFFQMSHFAFLHDFLKNYEVNIFENTPLPGNECRTSILDTWTQYFNFNSNNRFGVKSEENINDPKTDNCENNYENKSFS